MTVSVRFGCLLALLALVGCDGGSSELDAGLCPPGSAGCACVEDDRCDGSLFCQEGLCRDASRREVVVTDARARSCELVLVEDGTEVLGIALGAGARGTSIREAPRTAVAFFREDDTPFPSGAVSILSTDPMGSIRVRRGRCFDRDGVELSGEPLGIGG